jgi:hypothetical protein
MTVVGFRKSGRASSGHAREDRMDQPQRIAKLVLVTPDGAVVGSLPGFPVALPWWQDAESVVQAAREHHGIDVTVLRLLAADRDKPHGGKVTYLAEVRQPVPAETWKGRLEAHPLRQPYAEPGGPAADLDWAGSVLAKHGIAAVGPPEQVRSWNLSSVWRIPVHGQTVWLKVVPPFFAHEGRALAALADQAVPRLLGHDGSRILLAEIPGEDMYEAALPQLLDMVTLLVTLQASWIGRVEGLQAIGLPDWRGPALAVAVFDVVERTRGELSGDAAAALDRFVGNLPNRFAEIAACAIPDTLVHGDFHPGNVRGNAASLTLLDWGDCGIGHPLLDQPAFLGRVAAEYDAAIRARWNREWRAALPGCDPVRASLLLAPVAAARQAVLYRHFLDNIEPSEQVYHRSDPVHWLRRTATLLQKER